MNPTNDNTAQPTTPILQAQQPGVGAILREARESTSQSVIQIAARLRIRTEYIQALEDDHPENIPGRVYAIGFLRSYATYLDLDPLDLIRRYKATTDADPHSAELNFPKPAATRRQSPEFPAIAVSVAVLAAVLFGWYYFGGTGSPLTVNVSLQEAPKRQSSLAGALLPVLAPTIIRPTAIDPAIDHLAVPAPVRAQAAPDPEPQVQTALAIDDAAAKTDTSSQPVATLAASAPPPVEDTPPSPDAARVSVDKPSDEPKPRVIASLPKPPAEPKPFDRNQISSGEPTPAISGEPRSYGQINRDSRIVLTARTAIWVQVRDSKGGNVFTQMLAEGESYRVPNRPGLRLLTGNAGALDVVIDGKQAPSLGDFGMILRDLELDPDRLSKTTAADSYPLDDLNSANR